MKPREDWTREDLLDYLDGWHEASGTGFESKRNSKRVIVYTGLVDGLWKEQRYSTGEVIALGRKDREAHREATGI